MKREFRHEREAGCADSAGQLHRKCGKVEELEPFQGGSPIGFEQLIVATALCGTMAGGSVLLDYACVRKYDSGLRLRAVDIAWHLVSECFRISS